MNLFSQDAKESPLDPFDPNFCGGERVYPIVGINFATACGPRNQVSLGRRGLFVWWFPSPDGIRKEYTGRKNLTRNELNELIMLSEAVMLAEPAAPVAGGIIYNMGIDFSGRNQKGFYSTLSGKYSPANELYKKMLQHVPAGEIPLLPDCGTGMLFDPTLHQTDRLQILGDIALKTRNKTPFDDELKKLQGYVFQKY